jgi:hypothetical protein
MPAKSTKANRPPPPVASSSSASPESVPKVTRIVFTALLLDILAFTIILPLFPRLLQFYRDSEHGDQVTLFFNIIILSAPLFFVRWCFVVVL